MMIAKKILGVAKAATLDNDSPDVLRQGYSSIWEKNMADKVFKTYREQRQLLESRGLIIAHGRFFTNRMQEDDYYNIINGYKQYFLTGTAPERYIRDTTFEQVYALYDFDQTIRSLFLVELIKIEKHLKSMIAYHFSEKHGYDHRTYLTLDCFKNESNRNLQYANDIIKRLGNDISVFRRQGNTAICHYMEAYGYVPLWVLNSAISFGRIAHFYSCMKLSEQQAVAQHFKMSARTLDGFIYFLDDFRNACAHGNRMYTSNKRSGHQKFIPDTVEHEKMGIPRNQEGNYISGKTDVLAKLIALKYFSKSPDFRTLKRRFQAGHKKLEKIIPASILMNIDAEMGISPERLSFL